MPHFPGLPADRVEAVIFASREPIPREVLARVVGRGRNIDLLIAAIRAELRGRPYDLIAVAGGWQHRTHTAFAPAIRTATGSQARPLSHHETVVLLCIAYFQPITRGELTDFFGREVSRDLIAHLRARGFIGAGPRAPRQGTPYTYVTTRGFLSHFDLDSLRDLPDFEALEDAGLLSKDKLLAGDIGGGSADIPWRQAVRDE